ncbi:MAG: Rrf2 family transcriptional regulator [Hyphomicrobiales bacterium]|nr:Rrf2 family transcriptional regulator [Hyphomicrobiales bacterium]PCH50706.1 MAG: Rrf2 family transcriptional regulator [Hyphomicrobiales bacterium]
MKLTLQTDYALRILISLAQNPGQLQSVQDLANRFSVSKNHLMKTAQHLSAHGFIKTERGRKGGLRLAMLPKDIVIGNVIRKMEPNLEMAECFQQGEAGKACQLLPSCKLKGLLGEALASFLQVLEQKTLADIAS